MHDDHEGHEEGEVFVFVLTASASAAVRVYSSYHPIILYLIPDIIYSSYIFCPPTISYRYIFQSDINGVSSHRPCTTKSDALKAEYRFNHSKTQQNPHFPFFVAALRSLFVSPQAW